MEKSPKDTSKPAPTRRSETRAPVTIRCEARQGLRPWVRLTLEDLSCEGFRISGLPDPDPGQPLRIRIPGFQVLSARICWLEAMTTGCEFSVPLHEAVLSHIIAAHANA